MLEIKVHVNFYQLNNLFKKYSLKNRINFKGFITKIQGTCKHLLHAYTGMRNGEMLNTQSNCLESVPTNSGICRIISTTSKFTGTNPKTISPNPITQTNNPYTQNNNSNTQITT